MILKHRTRQTWTPKTLQKLLHPNRHVPKWHHHHPMVKSPTAAPTSSNATFAYFCMRPTKSAPRNHHTLRIPTSKSATFAWTSSKRTMLLWKPARSAQHLLWMPTLSNSPHWILLRWTTLSKVQQTAQHIRRVYQIHAQRPLQQLVPRVQLIPHQPLLRTALFHRIRTHSLVQQMQSWTSIPKVCPILWQVPKTTSSHTSLPWSQRLLQHLPIQPPRKVVPKGISTTRRTKSDPWLRTWLWRLLQARPFSRTKKSTTTTFITNPHLRQHQRRWNRHRRPWTAEQHLQAIRKPEKAPTLVTSESSDTTQKENQRKSAVDSEASSQLTYATSRLHDIRTTLQLHQEHSLSQHSQLYHQTSRTPMRINLCDNTLVTKPLRK